MISGTDFMIEDPEFIAHACRGLRPGVASISEIGDLVAKCGDEQALCLASEDGMVVVDLRPCGPDLELFVWLGVAFRHGAFERQDVALDKIGRDLGASQVAFQSRRRGWGRRLGPRWQRRGTDEFVRSIE